MLVNACRRVKDAFNETSREGFYFCYRCLYIIVLFIAHFISKEASYNFVKQMALEIEYDEIPFTKREKK